MVKRYKDGIMIEISKEESDKFKERLENHNKERYRKPLSYNDYEKRIKILEKTVAEILSRLNEEKSQNAPNEVET